MESQAAGRPVIARRGGGALETVVDGITGTFWTGGARELADAVAAFDDTAIDPQACIRNAARFNKASFRAGIEAEVEAAYTSNTRPAVGDRQPRPTARFVMRAARSQNR